MRDLSKPASLVLIGAAARAIPPIILGGLFVWMAMFIHGNGGRAVDWGGPAVLAFLCGATAAFTLLRAYLRRGADRVAKEVPSEPEPAFDADAAIRRYLEGRGTTLAGSEPVPGQRPPAARPSFGRKVSGS